ncbi:MAG: transposase [Subdoligranulum variabile]|uniref:Transposase n=1 Tax=Subdoligranulum variabile TaxID=214851 RepID=A0A943DBH4_9FIRM|nr:transposase [Subdoligranulum variabile]
MLKRDVLHADETTVQVLKELGKAAGSRSYMWVYRSGNDGLAPIILFEYRPGRSGEYAEKCLGDFRGYAHTDGYTGYNRLAKVTR